MSSDKSLNKKEEKEEDMKEIGPFKKVSNIRYVWGQLDLISAGLFIIGLYLSQINCLVLQNLGCSTLGFILMGIGALKQISKR